MNYHAYKKTIPALALLSCLSLTVVHSQIVSEDFEGGTVNSLTGTIFSGTSLSGTLNRVQDENYSPYGTEGDPFGTPQQYLQIVDNTGTNLLVSRATWASGVSISHVAFDYYQLSESSTFGEINFRFYNDQGLSSSERLAAVTFAAAGGAVNGSGTFYSLDTAYQVDFFLNNSTTSTSYNNPYDGSRSLDSGHYDLYIGGSSVLSNSAVGATLNAGNGDVIGGFEVFTSEATLGASLYLDNFEVSAIPESSTVGLFSSLAVLLFALMGRRRARG